MIAKLHGIKVDEKEITITLKVSGGSKHAALDLASSVGRDLQFEFVDPQRPLPLGEEE